MSSTTTTASLPRRVVRASSSFIADTARIGVVQAAFEAAFAFAGYLILTFAYLPAARDPHQTFYQDVLFNGIGPDRAAAADFLKHGVFPSWSRDLYGGAPFAANIQHAVFYPFNFPFLIWDVAFALKVVVITSVALVATATYLYCRHALRTTRLGAGFAGLAFGFGGMSLQHVILTNQLQAISIMPLVLLATHHVLVTGKLRHTVLLGVTTGIQLLAGHPEEWVYTLIAVGFYTLCWALAGVRSDEWRAVARSAAKGIGRVAAGMSLMVLLFGFQLLPTLQLKGQSYRTGTAFNDQFPLPKSIALNALLPDFGKRLGGENVGNVGIIALVLAGLGLAVARPGRRWVQVWAVVVSAFGFMMALGNANPFAKVLFDNISILHSFRVPSRYLMLPSFAFAAMAALGLDALLHFAVGLNRQALRQRLILLLKAGAILASGAAFALIVGGGTMARESLSRWLLAAFVALVCWALAAVPWVPRLGLAAVLIVGCSVELFDNRIKAEFHQRTPNATYNSSGPVLEHLAAVGGRYVTIADVPQTAEQRALVPLPPGVTTFHDMDYFIAAFQYRLIARPNTQVQDHVETVLGRDGGLLPLTTWNQFFDARVGAQGRVVQGVYLSPPSQWNWNTLDFLAVQHFVTGQTIPREEKVLADHGFKRVRLDGYVQTWSRNPEPIARLVTDVKVVSDPAARVGTLTKMDLTKQAVVEKPIAALTPGASPGTVTETKTGLTTVTMRTTTTRDSLLVLADPSYPGWKVSIDGKSKPILRVDHAFRGVVVPSGSHVVRFAYDDVQTKHGLELALLTILGLAGWSIYSSRSSSSTGLPGRRSSRERLSESR